ncbi:MAG: divergent polysaccharide deacetylase family protein [Gammaproteobacteria bacterium]|nr:divergent polysaccharide deacetylase family protein [Gammaproteobacteria bacterium]
MPVKQAAAKFREHIKRALTVFALGLTPLISSTQAADLAIVMDDIGHSLPRAARVMQLPGMFTVGLLPFAPNTEEIARLAHAAGKEVILHLPMQPRSTREQENETGTLTLDMPPDKFADLLDAALRAVPHCVGINNHAGSLLTEHRAPMVRLMRHIRRRGLFFLDSRTSPNTLAYTVAQEWQVPATKRDVFLDHRLERVAIAAEFKRALGIARKNGHAVLIAHPHRMSLDFLKTAMATLPDDVRLISLSELTNRRRPTMFARLENPKFPRKLPVL